MSFAIAILEENGFFHCSIRGKGILPLQFWRKMGFAIAVLEEKGLTQVPKDRIEEECPTMHWLKVTGLGATPYFEMMGQLDTLKDENRALEEKLAAASRGEQDMGVRRAWGGRGLGAIRTWGVEDLGVKRAWALGARSQRWSVDDIQQCVSRRSLTSQIGSEKTSLGPQSDELT